MACRPILPSDGIGYDGSGRSDAVVVAGVVVYENAPLSGRLQAIR